MPQPERECLDDGSAENEAALDRNCLLVLFLTARGMIAKEIAWETGFPLAFVDEVLAADREAFPGEPLVTVH